MIYPEVHFPMEASLCWSGMESQGSPNSHQCHTGISSCPHQCGVPRTTMGPLSAVTKPVQGWGNLHNLIGGSQQNPEAPKSPEQQRPCRASKHPRGTSSRAPKHPRVISFSTFTSTNHRGEIKPMQPMQWQEHKKCSNPSLSNPTNETNAMKGEDRKNKDELNN